MVRSGYLALIVLVPTLGSVLLGSTRCAAADPEFDKLVDDYFAARFDYRPSEGTAAGLHEYDHRLEELSLERTARRIDELHHISLLHVRQARDPETPRRLSRQERGHAPRLP